MCFKFSFESLGGAVNQFVLSRFTNGSVSTLSLLLILYGISQVFPLYIFYLYLYIKNKLNPLTLFPIVLGKHVGITVDTSVPCEQCNCRGNDRFLQSYVVHIFSWNFLLVAHYKNMVYLLPVVLHSVSPFPLPLPSFLYF